MTCSAHVSAAVVDTTDVALAPRSARTQRILGIVLLVAVITVDQGTKAWAWRHVPGVFINVGSTGGIGGPMNGWFAGRATGAILDVLDVGVLSVGAFVLARTPRAPARFISAAVTLAGWGSNLLDRLGMHCVTAPGSARGAVDFIPLGRYKVNVADVFIIGGTIVFLALIAFAMRPAASSRPRMDEPTQSAGARPFAHISSLRRLGGRRPGVALPSPRPRGRRGALRAVDHSIGVGMSTQGPWRAGQLLPCLSVRTLCTCADDAHRRIGVDAVVRRSA